MKVGLMQPYLFPYLGYFQLINAVDKFVIADDVQYIRHGWINRNNIRVMDKAHVFTFSVKKDSREKNINERFYSDKDFEIVKENLFENVNYSYKKSPYFSEIYQLLSEIFKYNNLNVAEFNTNSLKILCNYMGIHSDFLVSSSLTKNNELKRQDFVIEVNRVLGSDCYINSIGGMELYSKKAFEENNISLKFIKMNDVTYDQGGKEFIPFLSIIDVLMYNSKDKILDLLNEYTLV